MTLLQHPATTTKVPSRNQDHYPVCVNPPPSRFLMILFSTQWQVLADNLYLMSFYPQVFASWYVYSLSSPCQGRSSRRRGYSNVLSLLRSLPEFSVLVKALELTDLASSLEAGGPFTVFAPSNFAFDRIGRDKMLANVDGLENETN